jgi:hypothetical protein
LVAALREDFVNAEHLIQQAKGFNSESFLVEIAEVIYLNHKNPQQAKAHLVQALNNTKMPASEKLAFIIQDMQGSTQLH